MQAEVTKKKKRKARTPLEDTAAGYKAPAPAAPEPEPLIDDPKLLRARAWCRRRSSTPIWGLKIGLENLDRLGVVDRCARVVALLAEAMYFATDQANRVHRCPRRERCFLCQTPAYADQNEPMAADPERQQFLVAQQQFVDRANDGNRWRQQVLDLTGVCLNPEESDDEVWQLLQQVAYALDSYKELAQKPHS